MSTRKTHPKSKAPKARSASRGQSAAKQEGAVKKTAKSSSRRANRPRAPEDLRARPSSEEAETSARAFLLARGLDISPADLDRLVVAAVERLPRVLHASDPATDLTPPDREALVRGGFHLEHRRGEASPVARTIAEYAALLRHSKTVAELAKLLGVNESRIRQRLSSTPPTLYGFKVEGEWRIPAFVLAGKELVPGISEVAAAVDPGIHPVAFYRWFTSPEPDLTIEDDEGTELVVSPRDWLISGHPSAAVAELAADV